MKMVNWRRCLPVVVLVACLVMPSIVENARAQEPLEFETEAAPTKEKEWGLAITPYAWFAAQSSEVGGESIRQSFNDLASLTNFGFQMRLLARWRWLVFTADGTYADMGTNSEQVLAKIDLALKQYILDLKLGGLIHDTRTAAQDGGVGIWAAAGARYWDNQITYTITVAPGSPLERTETESTAQTWWDPVLGLTLHFPVTPAVGFLVKATGGGFGIGSASTYMWDGEFVALFRLSRRFLLSAGYRQFKYDRTDGSGEDEVRQVVTVTGPSVGLSIGLF